MVKRFRIYSSTYKPFPIKAKTKLKRRSIPPGLVRYLGRANWFKNKLFEPDMRVNRTAYISRKEFVDMGNEIGYTFTNWKEELYYIDMGMVPVSRTMKPKSKKSYK